MRANQYISRKCPFPWYHLYVMHSVFVSSWQHMYACHRGCVHQWQPEHDGGCVTWVYTSGIACSCAFFVGQMTVHRTSASWNVSRVWWQLFLAENCVQLDPGVIKGRQSIKDRESPGRPAEVTGMVTWDLYIMHEQLKFCKVCACWVLHWLTEEQKNIQNGSVLAALQLVHWGRRGLHGMNCYRRWVLGAPLSTRIRKDLPWNGNIPPR